MPYLFVREGDRENIVKLRDRLVTVGRSRINIIVLSDRESSRRQCTIRKVRDIYQLEDVGSRNGTCVNGETVMRHPLQAGDLIEIGLAKIFFLNDILPETLAQARATESRCTKTPGSEIREVSATMRSSRAGHARKKRERPSRHPVFSPEWLLEEFQGLLRGLGPEGLHAIQAWDAGSLCRALESVRYFWVYGGPLEKRFPVTLPAQFEVTLRPAEKTALVRVHVDELRVTAQAQGPLEAFDARALFHEAYRILRYALELLPDLENMRLVVETVSDLTKRSPSVYPVLSIDAGRVQLERLEPSRFEAAQLAEVVDVRFGRLDPVAPHEGG